MVEALTGEEEDYLASLYYDPENPAALTSPDLLYKQVKKEGRHSLSRGQIKLWLSKQDAYTLHKQTHSKFKRQPVYAPYKNYMWESDLGQMTRHKSKNNGYAFFIVYIDVNSRYAYTRPLKTKKSEAVLAATREIFREAAPNKPERLRFDKGGEFKGRNFRDFLEREGVKYFATENETKAAYAERLLKTLKLKLYRWMTRNNSEKWVELLPQVTASYNAKYHRGIKMAPKDVTDKDADRLWNIKHGVRPRKDGPFDNIPDPLVDGNDDDDDGDDSDRGDGGDGGDGRDRRNGGGGAAATQDGNGDGSGDEDSDDDAGPEQKSGGDDDAALGSRDGARVRDNGNRVDDDENAGSMKKPRKRPYPANAGEADGAKKSSEKSRKKRKPRAFAPFKYKIGDSVRVSHLKHVFSRAYDSLWSEEIFFVTDRFLKNDVKLYRIKDYNNENISGTFYENELQAVTVTRDTLYKIDHIVRKEKKNGRSGYVVRWSGYTKAADSWVPEEEVVDLGKD